MAYPKQSEVEIPLLKALVARGGTAEPKTLYASLASEFGLTEDEQQERMEHGAKRWWNLVQWVRQKLVERGEIDGSQRGVWKITEKGRARIGSPVGRFGRTAALTKARARVLASPTFAAPQETTLRDLMNALHTDVRNRLIEELRNLTPSAFERFCGAFLQQLGYEEIAVIGRTGDGGVDGHGDFRQGAVAIKSAFQAKRWKQVVSREAIDKFRGAIQGEYDHGVFLTTGSFTAPAQQASFKKGAITIMLLDAEAIARLMLERGIGVTKQPLMMVELDPTFFDFEE